MPESHASHSLDTRTVNRIGLAALLVFLGVAAGMYFYWEQLFPRQAAVTEAMPPPPRLQTHAPEDLAALREEKQAALSGYAWVDRPRGVARIPIERAMALLAEGRQDGPQ